MKTITKQSLDVLARTMSVIPMSKLMGIIAGGDGYTSINFNNQASFESYMNQWITNSNFVELSYYRYADGTWEVFRYATNTSHSCTTPGPVQYGNSVSGYSYEFGGKTIIGRGHIHGDNSFPSNSDFLSAAETPGLPCHIYYGNGFYMTYGSNNYGLK